MSKPNEDPNTDGKGTATEVDSEVEVDAGQLDGSDTSADNEEGNDETTPIAEVDSPAPEITPEVDDEDDDDEPLVGDNGEKQFTQTDVDKFVKERVKKEKSKFSTTKTALESTITSLTDELAAYRNAEKDAVKAALEALPDEVKILAPSTLDTAEGVASIKSWLPKVSALAAKLTAKPDEEKPKEKIKAGNGGDPKPTGVTPLESEADVISKAKAHSIYSSF